MSTCRQFRIRAWVTSALVAVALAASPDAASAATVTEMRVVANTGMPDLGEAGELRLRPAISADGRFVAWITPAGLRGNSLSLRDLVTGGTRQITPLSHKDVFNGGFDSETPVLSADGRYLAFASDWAGANKEDLDTEETPTGTDTVQDVFVYDRLSRKTRLVSRRSGAHGEPARRNSARPSISEDGDVVAYTTDGSNLAPSGPERIGGVYERDLPGEENRVVSAEPGIQWWRPSSFEPALSGDGHRIAYGFQFSSHPWNPEHPPRNPRRWAQERHKEIMLRDPGLKRPQLVSRGDGRDGTLPNDDCTEASVSQTGRFVAFACSASNLVPGDDDGVEDVFVRNLADGTTTLVSSSTSRPLGNGDSNRPSISADGRFVAFQSKAGNLVSGDGDGLGEENIFVKDMQTGALTLVSAALSGPPPANGSSANPTITPDGTYLVFDSTASNLSSEDAEDDLSVYRARLQP